MSQADRESASFRDRGGSDPPPTPGPRASLLGDFELVREIGRGGMGTVFEARQRSLNRVVAIKVLERHVSGSSGAITRFQREAQAAAKLHHPNIVPIYAQGEESGVYFYAMELVDGEGLNAIIARHRDRAAADTATVDLQATVALKRSGSNAASGSAAETVVVQPLRGDSGRVELSGSRVALAGQETRDFIDIARHIAEVAGALHYAHGVGVVHRDIKPHNLLMGRDGRLRISDFGLARLAEQPGMTMTGELLGSPLYMSPEQIMGDPSRVDHRTDVYSLGATLYEWITLSPPYPGETRERVIGLILSAEPKAPRLLNARVPVDLETVCLKAIERNPDRRYSSALALQDDLRRFLDRQPIHARRIGTTARTARFIRRHQFGTLGIAALGVAALLGYALYNKQTQIREQTEVAAAVQARADKILDIVGSLPLEVGAALRVAGGVGELMDPARQALAPTIADSVSIATPSSIALMALKEYFTASMPADWPPRNEDAGNPMLRGAFGLWQSGDLDGADSLLQEYLRLHPRHLEALQFQAELSAQRSKFDAVLSAADAMGGTQPRPLCAMIWRGAALLLLGQVEESVVELKEATRKDDASVWAKVLHGLALIANSRADGAVLELEDALRLEPELTVARLGRASAYYSAGKLDRAIAEATAVIESQPNNADAYTIRGDCHLALQDLDSALRDFDKAIELAGSKPALSLRSLSVLMGQQRAAKEREVEKPAAPASTNPASGVMDWFSRVLSPGGGGPPKQTPPRPSREAPRSGPKGPF